MKLKAKLTIEVDASYCQVDIRMRPQYINDDSRAIRTPMYNPSGDTVTLMLDIATGQVVNHPTDTTWNVMAGDAAQVTYTLLRPDKKPIITKTDHMNPGHTFTIFKVVDGYVKPWPKPVSIQTLFDSIHPSKVKWEIRN